MLYSMTGFGRDEKNAGNKHITVEIRSLNGKQFDISSKLPPVLKPYETDIRSLLSQRLHRGTLDISVSLRQEGASKPMAVNISLAKYYYESIHQISTALGLSEGDILPTLMRMPEVVAPDTESLAPEEWEPVREVIELAAAKLMQHRLTEGQSLYADLKARTGKIMELLTEILPLEGARSERVRQRIMQSLSDVQGSDKLDMNRLEQELVYYVERMDFSEEKTRLQQHCVYFMEVLDRDEPLKGKMLGFILQEIGREINTLGSKANDASIQKIVVQMKDELEKAKEQVLNVL